MLLSTNTLAWSPFGPKNYDECILENMKGTTDQTATVLIMQSCKNKFPEQSTGKPCTTRTLSEYELMSLQFTAGTVREVSTVGPYVTIDIYNGNKFISITELSIEISGKNLKSPQEYNLYLSSSIEPLSSGSAGGRIQTMPGNDWKFKPTSIKTCQ